MTRRAPGWRAVPAALAADRFVQAYVAVFVAELAWYLAPGVAPALRATVGEAMFLLPFCAVTTAGAFAGLGRIPDPAERRYWRTVAIACAAWLAAVLVYTLELLAPGEPDWFIVVDGLYLSTYVPLLHAIERRPHLGESDSSRDPTRLAALSGAAMAVLGWFVYLTVLPAAFDQALVGSFLPTYLLFLVLDTMLVALYFVVGRRCGIARWRALYWGVGAGVLAMGCTDILDLLIESGLLTWADGAPTDLLWVIPPGVFLLAARLRHIPIGNAGAGRAERPWISFEERAYSGGMMLVGALSFPLVHFWLHDVVALKPALERAQSLLVLAMLGLLGALAARMYTVLGSRHLDLARMRQALEDQLRETQRFEAVGRLAGGVAHDFNNMLTSIVGHNDLALEGLPADDPSRPALAEISKAAARAAALTKQLLAFSRRQILKPVRSNLNTIVTAAVPVLARLIGEDILVKTDLAPDLVDVTVDPDQVQSVIYALAVRARDAMPRGGTLVIATRHTPARPDPGASGPVAVELSMHDTGTAIDIAALPVIFEPFATPSRDKGLGLAAVHGIVTQSGGTITAASAEGTGTTFRIVLPPAG